jgi:hypothetical protein
MTARGEHVIVDYDVNGHVIGIELASQLEHQGGDVEEASVEILLVVVHKDSTQPTGEGIRRVKVMPRIGEFIELVDEAGQAHFYRVTAVMHATDSTTAYPEVFAVYEGSNNDVRRKLMPEWSRG